MGPGFRADHGASARGGPAPGGPARGSAARGGPARDGPAPDCPARDRPAGGRPDPGGAGGGRNGGLFGVVRLGVEQRPAVHDPLQRPASADHPETGHRVREADRDQGQRAQRRRGRAGPADRDRGQPLPGRRVLHRELPAAGVPAGQGPAGGGAQQHAGRHPVEVQLPAGRLGGRVRPGQRAHLQPQPDQQEPAAHVGDAARRPQIQRQARPGRRGDRLPADRHLGAARARRPRPR